MASLQEQLRLLVNPQPKSLDPELDEYDVTTAKTVKGIVDEEEKEFLSAQSSVLRKTTAPLLGDEDVKYAGKKTSRAEMLAERENDDKLERDEELFIGENDEEGDFEETDQSDDEDPNQSKGIFQKKVTTNGKPYKHTTDKSEEESSDNKSSDINDDNIQEDDDLDDKSSDSENDNNTHDDDIDIDDRSSDAEDDSNNDDDVDIDDERVSSSDSEEHDGFQPFLTKNAEDDVEKGIAAKNQISLWDSFLETRIRLQKSLVLVNKLPQFDTLKEFISAGGNNLAEPLNQGSTVVKDLLWNLLLLQERLLEQNAETKNILCGGMDTNQSEDIDDNEEIPSDTEDEDKDEKESVKELKTSRNDIEKKTLRLPVKRKNSMTVEDYNQIISKRHLAFENYRNLTISKWSEKMRLSSGKLTSKSFSSFDRSTLVQIQKVLSDKERLIKRTQLKRSAYRVLGKPEQKQSKSTPNAEEEHSDAHLKDYDPEIFDDDDFYHQLLRELIERRTNVSSDDPVAMGRQWLELQRLRRKFKKKIDTKASKGRRIRYNVHPKLVNFMAPKETGSSTDAYRNELFSSLFGQQQSAEPETNDITIMR